MWSRSLCSNVTSALILRYHLTRRVLDFIDDELGRNYSLFKLKYIDNGNQKHTFLFPIIYGNPLRMSLGNKVRNRSVLDSPPQSEKLPDNHRRGAHLSFKKEIKYCSSSLTRLMGCSANAHLTTRWKMYLRCTIPHLALEGDGHEALQRQSKLHWTLWQDVIK